MKIQKIAYKPSFMGNYDSFLKCKEFYTLNCNKSLVEFKNAFENNRWNNEMNPILIIGKTGLGKSHFLQYFFESQIIKLNSTKIGFWKANRFVDDFINAIMENKCNDFIKYCYELDILIIDDIEYLVNKSKTQDYFTLIFDGFIRSKKIMLFSTSIEPEKLKFEPKLKSRLISGLKLNIDKPTLTDINDYINFKYAEYNIPKNIDILSKLNLKHFSDFRKIQGCLINNFVSK